MELSHQSVVASMIASDSDSFALCGSSTMMRLPPSPVVAASVEVEMRLPPRLFE
jgi:hypothetical protein